MEFSEVRVKESFETVKSFWRCEPEIELISGYRGFIEESGKSERRGGMILPEDCLVIDVDDTFGEAIKELSSGIEFCFGHGQIKILGGFLSYLFLNKFSFVGGNRKYPFLIIRATDIGMDDEVESVTAGAETGTIPFYEMNDNEPSTSYKLYPDIG